MAKAFHTAVQEIRALARDRRSGAAELAERAAAALLRFLRAQGSVTREQLAMLAEALLRAQPSMAPLLNLSHLVAQAAKRDASPQELQRAVGQFRRGRREANQKIARRFAARLRRRSVVLTYSYSSTVLAALVAARRKIKRVVCSEARPMLEGRRLAAKLAAAGIPAVLVADAALPGKIAEADMVVVGADAILPGPAAGGAGAYVNKIGTRVLQAEARRADKPFYVLADSSKILSPRLVRFYRVEEKPAAELWRRAPQGVQVENRYFERIPLRRGVVVLTEKQRVQSTSSKLLG